MTSESPRATSRQMITWAALAFAPASLMVGVTMYLTSLMTQAGWSLPMLWVLPLSLYAQSFFLTLAAGSNTVTAAAERRFGMSVTVALFFIVTGLRLPPLFVVPLHLLALGVTSTLCHAKLAERLPVHGARRQFAVSVAAGAVAGVLFNTALAPLVFARFEEYSIVLACTCFIPVLMRSSDRHARFTPVDVVIPMIAGTLAMFALSPARSFVGDAAVRALMMGIPTLVAFSQSRKPARFAMTIGAVVVAATLAQSARPGFDAQSRTFFGSSNQTLRYLLEGTHEAASSLR